MAAAKLAKKATLDYTKAKEILDDPVKWAQIFVNIFDNATKQKQPWVARWYQAEMMRDESDKKVYRCGRRTGKSECMVMEALKNATTKKHYRILIVTPYETQVRLLFMRINEILDESPLLKSMVTRNVKNPYIMEFNNGCAILGFTTGASSGSGAASIRGQKADLIVLDECDYMSSADFDSVMAIAGEREGIKIIMSSTPTGRRGHFYYSCTDPKRGFSHHHHPSTHNPHWSLKMESEFRAMLSEQGYVHEIMAEFGTQDTGVFNKDKVDAAMRFKYYAYDKLSYIQEEHAKIRKQETGEDITYYLYDKMNPAPFNPLRTMAVDWDKFGASSSIVILEYIPEFKKFMVLKRIEVPRAQYHYDAAVNLIIELNEIYNPSWIYCDAGAGEYQVERLHIHGDEHPETGLKHKVIRRNFKQSLDIEDPITHEIEKKPLKHFMINQLQIAFERDLIILSPFDEILHKQLIDYEVIKYTGVTHDPVFTDKNEHFVDALGLAYLAFVVEFNDLIDMVRDTTRDAILTATATSFAKKSLNDLYKRNAQKDIYKSMQNNSISDPFQDEPTSKVLIPVTINANNPYQSLSSRIGPRRGTSSRTKRSAW